MTKTFDIVAFSIIGIMALSTIVGPALALSYIKNRNNDIITLTFQMITSIILVAICYLLLIMSLSAISIDSSGYKRRKRNMSVIQMLNKQMSITNKILLVMCLLIIASSIIANILFYVYYFNNTTNDSAIKNALWWMQPTIFLCIPAFFGILFSLQ